MCVCVCVCVCVLSGSVIEPCQASRAKLSLLGRNCLFAGYTIVYLKTIRLARASAQDTSVLQITGLVLLLLYPLSYLLKYKKLQLIYICT